MPRKITHASRPLMCTVRGLRLPAGVYSIRAVHTRPARDHFRRHLIPSDVVPVFVRKSCKIVHQIGKNSCLFKAHSKPPQLPPVLVRSCAAMPFWAGMPFNSHGSKLIDGLGALILTARKLYPLRAAGKDGKRSPRPFLPLYYTTFCPLNQIAKLCKMTNARSGSQTQPPPTMPQKRPTKPLKSKVIQTTSKSTPP